MWQEMRNPTFSKAGVTTVTFSRGVLFPIRKSTNKRQLMNFASGGTPYVLTMSTNKDIFIDISFANLTATDISNLITFFDDAAVNWRASTFTYTDSENTATTIRLVAEDLSQIRNTDRNHGIALILREET